MSYLGEFGAELRAVEGDDETGGRDFFTYHGVEFDLPVQIGGLPMLKYAHESIKHVEERESARRKVMRTLQHDPDALQAAYLDIDAAYRMASMSSLYTFLRGVIPDPVQWAAFERIAIEVGDEEDELMETAQKIIAAVVGRPTKRRTGSSGGPQRTGATSPDVSSSSASDPIPTGPSGSAQPAQVLPSMTRGPGDGPLMEITTTTPREDRELAAVVRVDEGEQAADLTEKIAERQRWMAEMVPVESLADTGFGG